MARALTNEELCMIDEELKENKIPRREIAEHIRGMRGYDPRKKVKFRGINPEQTGISGKINMDNQIYFR